MIIVAMKWHYRQEDGMKLIKKKILIVVLVMVLAFSMGISIVSLYRSFEIRRSDTTLSYTYSEIVVRINSEDKISFAKEKDELYRQAFLQGTIKKVTEEDLAKLIENATFQQESLEEYGVYLLPTPVNTENVSENIWLSKPTVFYNAGEQTWIITHSGKWINNKWNQFFFNGPLGEKDVYGIRYTDISGKLEISLIKNNLPCSF